MQTNSDVRLAEITTTVKYISEKVDRIINKMDMLDEDFVTRKEFTNYQEKLDEKLKPLIKIFWQVVSFTGLAILGALLTLVITNK